MTIAVQCSGSLLRAPMGARLRLCAIVFFAHFCALACFTQVSAGTYPDRPVHIIVPFAAGGTVDIVARIIGAKLADITGGRVVIDNHGGAGGVVGTEMAARSPADGYTLLLHSASITYDPTLHDKLPYDTMRDLAPVAMIGATPNLLVVSPSFPARSVQDLLALGREKPGGTTFATGGFGSSSHLAAALFGYLSGVKFNHVPYKGAGPALANVVAGHVDFTLATMPGAISYVRTGALRALGISSRVRTPELPEVPTIAEAGVPGYEYVAWFGVFAPGSTPPVLVTRINDLVRQAVSALDTRELLHTQGVQPQLLSPDQFRQKVQSEIEHWAPIIEKSGMKGSL